MNPTETAALIGAIVALLGALQAWIVSRTIVHGRALNGAMDNRIANGAAAAVGEDHAKRGDLPTPNPAQVNAARIAALEGEIASLKAPAPGQPPTGTP